MVICNTLGAKLAHAWHSVQVELHGQYSLTRLATFHAYTASASTARVVTIMLLTPLPCLLAVALSDSFPLEPPEKGIGSSQWFWARGEFTTFIYSHATALQLQFYVPRLHIPLRDRFAISIPSSVLTNVTAYLMARVIGFPLPFTLPALSVPWLTYFVGFLLLTRGRFLRANPDVLRDLLQYSLVMMCQMSMIIFYPFFYSAFSNFSASSQTLFALFLPVMKLLQKNLICRVLVGRDDIKPEIVIFNVEIFNSLFVSCCMQSASSINTNLVIMGADFLQAWAGIYDLDKMLADVNQLAEKMGMQKGKLVETAMDVLKHNPHITRNCTIQKLDDEAGFGLSMASVNGNQVVPQPHDNGIRSINEDEARKVNFLAWQSDQVKSLMAGNGEKVELGSRTASIADVLTKDERLQFVQKALQILYLTEFLLLIEFTEVMIPVVYCVYLMVLYHLPNRVYYPQIGSMDPAALTRTIQNVFLYAVMELVSFLVLNYILKRKLHISAIHQLTFVLEKQWKMVQSKLVLWVVFMLQSTLQHLGADYTFKFKWLKRDT